MGFSFLDWSAIVAYLVITLILGLWFRGRAGKSVDDYFVSGRDVNWWLAGTSMVATTFAADTPLLVTGLVYAQGVSGNWLWWGLLLSGMMTVFLFARLWRRSGLLTDVQFAELRYAGKPAAFLRGFRAIYLGLLMNCLILGWVTKAMVSIVSTIFAGTPLLAAFSHTFSHLGTAFAGDNGAALAICVFVLIPFTGLYVSLGGLWGVLWTDLFQFVLKMSIVIVIAYYAVRPWPWILTALAVIVLYPNLEHPETGYMLVLKDHVPHAFLGIAMAGFLAAFMSTIATQLNWGASYLVADFYRRFVRKQASESHYVNVSRIVTVLLVVCSAYASVQLTSIAQGWQIVLEVGAGTGAVYLLRWYWWRINAWSEISAMATALITTLILHFTNPFSGTAPVLFAKTALTTAGVTSIAWIVVTLLTAPEGEAVLDNFYARVRPDSRGWAPVASSEERRVGTPCSAGG